MNSKVTFTILALFVLYSPSAQGIPVTVETGNPRCQCTNYVDNKIPLKQMTDIDLFPSGPHCPRLEIIATLQGDKMVCLKPAALWVKRIIDKILKNN
ncbi:interleukin-8-like [Rhinoraja longicauda]